MSRIKKLLARVVNKIAKGTQQRGTQLPVDGDARADKANLVIYRNIAREFGVDLEEGDIPVAWGDPDSMDGFDARIQQLVADGLYFATYELAFADDLVKTADTGLDTASIREIFQRYPIAVVWTSPSECKMYGRWCDIMSAMAAMKLAGRSNPSSHIGEAW